MIKIDMKLEDDCPLPMYHLDGFCHEGLDVMISMAPVKGVDIKGEECTGTVLFINANPRLVMKNWGFYRTHPNLQDEEEE